MRISLLLGGIITLGAVYAIDDLSLAGNNELHFTVSQENDSLHRYVEDWAGISLSYKKIGIDLRYEAHTPPSLGNLNRETRHGISLRTVSFQSDNMTIKAGHFYTMLGKGLTLRIFEKRELGWDTKIDGAFFKYFNEKIDLTLLAGIPYAAHGAKYEPLEAGEISFSPHDIFQFGATMVVTNRPARNSYWESIYFSLNLPFGSLYTEYAAQKLEEFLNPDTAKAIYLTTTLFIMNLSVLAEYKYYSDYYLYEGMVYNNPPSVIKEHYFSLLNRHQLLSNADDEQGFFLEATYPIIGDNLLTSSFAYSTNKAKSKKYYDFYGQYEFQFPQTIDWIIASGYQKENLTRHLSFVLNPTWTINEKYSFKFEFQHQHTALNDFENYKQVPKFYTQSYIGTLGIYPNISFSLFAETTSDRQSPDGFSIGKNHYWLGAGLSITFLESHDLTIFGGTRRGGKNCAGGICKNEPALKGLELKMTSRF